MNWIFERTNLRQTLWSTLRKKCPYSELLWSVSNRIQSECGKIQTRITPDTDTFNAVQVVVSEVQSLVVTSTLMVRGSGMSRQALHWTKLWKVLSLEEILRLAFHHKNMKVVGPNHVARLPVIFTSKLEQ